MQLPSRLTYFCQQFYVRSVIVPGCPGQTGVNDCQHDRALVALYTLFVVKTVQRETMAQR